MLDYVSGLLIVGGLCFYLAGTLGLLRMPDVYTRLHAVTKADNLGLGLLTFGLLFQAGDLRTGLKLVFIWLLVLYASAVGSYLIARFARRRDSLRGSGRP